MSGYVDYFGVDYSYRESFAYRRATANERARITREQMAARKRAAACSKRCCEIVRALGILEARPDDSKWMPHVIELLRGVGYEVFRELDEHTGNFVWGGYKGLTGEWHWKLRATRNHPEYGRALFDAINEGAKPGQKLA